MAILNIRPAHYAISVADLDESIAWYEEMLGFHLVSKGYVEPPQSVIATLANGDFQIELFLNDHTKPLQDYQMDPDVHTAYQGPQHMAFYAEDLDALMEHLTSHGVKILVGPAEMDGRTLYYIADNTGIPIEIMSM